MGIKLHKNKIGDHKSQTLNFGNHGQIEDNKIFCTIETEIAFKCL